MIISTNPTFYFLYKPTQTYTLWKNTYVQAVQASQPTNLTCFFFLTLVKLCMVQEIHRRPTTVHIYMYSKHAPTVSQYTQWAIEYRHTWKDAWRKGRVESSSPAHLVTWTKKRVDSGCVEKS